MPIKVIISQVEQHTRVGHELARPIQLEAGQLRDEYVHARFGDQRIRDRQPDVAAGLRPLPRGSAYLRHDRGEHAGGGGLAVSTGNHQPVTGSTEDAGAVEAEAQLHVADDLEPGRGRSYEQRGVRPPARRSHHAGELAQAVGGLSGSERGRAGRLVEVRTTGGVVVGNCVRDAELCEQLRRAQAGHARAGDQDGFGDREVRGH